MGSPEPNERTFVLDPGAFRALEWPGNPEATVVFLHGLSGVADVWTDTVGALGAGLGANRFKCIAIDQRAHGRSPRTPGKYAAADYLGDLIELVDHLGAPVHLVGHSMGARVAILAAARHPELLRSATIVDIGPESWVGNIDVTTKLFAALPESFPSRAAALDLARGTGRGEQWAQRFVDWRLRAQNDGTSTWLASRDGLIETVTTQRSRNYWADWDRITMPTLLVRGGISKEVRPRIAEEMQRRNPSVEFVEIEGVGHNIPLLAPDRLAYELTSFWAQAGAGPARTMARPK